MKQLKVILTRLKNPAVLLSITSQLLTLVMLIWGNQNMSVFKGVIAAVSSIFVMLGIVSDPTAPRKTSGDDMLPCSHCRRRTAHYLIAGKLLCCECGKEYSKKDDLKE